MKRLLASLTIRLESFTELAPWVLVRPAELTDPDAVAADCAPGDSNTAPGDEGLLPVLCFFFDAFPALPSVIDAVSPEPVPFFLFFRPKNLTLLKALDLELVE